MLGDIFFCSFFAFKYIISFFFFPLQFVIVSAAPILLHLHRERRYRCFTFCFVTTADLLLRLLTLNTYTISCFFAHRVQKRSFYDSVRTLTSKNIGGTLFVVCLSLNWFFLPFSGLLTLKLISHSYLVAVYTLNTQKHLISLFRTSENVIFPFAACLRRSKIQWYLFFSCKRLDMLQSTLFFDAVFSHFSHQLYLCS